MHGIIYITADLCGINEGVDFEGGSKLFFLIYFLRNDLIKFTNTIEELILKVDHNFNDIELRRFVLSSKGNLPNSFLDPMFAEHITWWSSLFLSSLTEAKLNSW